MAQSSDQDELGLEMKIKMKIKILIKRTIHKNGSIRPGFSFYVNGTQRFRVAS